MTRSLYLVVAFALTLTACKDHRNLAPPLARAVPASVGGPKCIGSCTRHNLARRRSRGHQYRIVPTSSEGATTATVQGDSPASLATSRDIDDLPIILATIGRLQEQAEVLGLAVRSETTDRDRDGHLPSHSAELCFMTREGGREDYGWAEGRRG